MRSKLVSSCVVCVLIATTGIASAGLPSEAIEVGSDYVMKKFGTQVGSTLGKDGAELLTARMETMAVKYGEKETVSAVEQVGPQAFRLIEEAGEDAAPQAVRLMDRVGMDSVWIIGRKKSMGLFLKYGDDAADAMIKHKAIAEGLIEQFGPSSARALNSISGQNARRLAILAEDGELATVPECAKLLDTVGKYGDRAMEWVWNNKGAIVTTAVVAKFIQNPQPFIDGTVKVADVGTDKLLKPVATELATGIAKSTNWTMVILSVFGSFVLLNVFRCWRLGRSNENTPGNWLTRLLPRRFRPTVFNRRGFSRRDDLPEDHSTEQTEEKLNVFPEPTPAMSEYDDGRNSVKQ